MLHPGHRLGRYKVIKALGEPGEGGGQGSVYLAEDGQGARYAVKVPNRRGPRFERELAAAKAVQSRRVARVWAYDLSVPLIAYEHIPGITLSRALRAGDIADDDLPRLFAQVAQGLADIHAVRTTDIPSLSHGDLTLDNIMIVTGSEVMIVDLGAVGTGAGHTISREGIGKPGYFAPEQLTGPSRGAATDIWQLGICLARAGTGHMPFPYGNAISVLDQTPNVDGLPTSLADAAAECLHKEPERRPTAAEVAEMLERAARDLDEDRTNAHQPAQGHTRVRPVTDIRFDVDHLGLIRRAAIFGTPTEDIPALVVRL